MGEQEWQSRDGKVDGGAVKGKLCSWNRSQRAVTEPEGLSALGLYSLRGEKLKQLSTQALTAAPRVLQGSGIFLSLTALPESFFLGHFCPALTQLHVCDPLTVRLSPGSSLGGTD